MPRIEPVVLLTALRNQPHGLWRGTSGGVDPRGDVDTWRQIAAWRCAISFLETHPKDDQSRIGLWGTRPLVAGNIFFRPVFSRPERFLSKANAISR